MNSPGTISRASAAIQLLRILATRPDWRHGERLAYVLRMARRHVFFVNKKRYFLTILTAALPALQSRFFLSAPTGIRGRAA